MTCHDFSRVPLIDVSDLMHHTARRSEVGERIGQACRECGFFYVVGHGVDEQLCQRLEDLSRRFFAQDISEKMRIAMSNGGRAWRGYFPVGNELTSGKPDQKEGIYFGAELPDDHSAVKAGKPLHGQNLFPDIPGFRETILEYLAALTKLGHSLMAGMAMGLGLDENYFHDRYTAEPLILFRVFNYPHMPTPTPAASDSQWGVGEHTDYGLLTILRQDDTGGLQVKSRSQWIEAPPIPGSFICNLGDMLDRLTRGTYRSTPHRVINRSSRDRLSFPFFFDPNFDALIQPIEGLQRPADTDNEKRWDNANVHAFSGTYGEYLLNKVTKVFPELRKEVL